MCSGQKKAQGLRPWAGVWRLAIPYFRTAKCRTIIGAGRFHFRVRDGSGWFTPAMVTKQFGVKPVKVRGPTVVAPFALGRLFCNSSGAAGFLLPAVFSAFCLSSPHGNLYFFLSLCAANFAGRPSACLFSKPIGRYRVKPHGQLVRVSCMHCCTSTPRLSTS